MIEVLWSADVLVGNDPAQSDVIRFLGVASSTFHPIAPKSHIPISWSSWQPRFAFRQCTGRKAHFSMWLLSWTGSSNLQQLPYDVSSRVLPGRLPRRASCKIVEKLEGPHQLGKQTNPVIATPCPRSCTNDLSRSSERLVSRNLIPIPSFGRLLKCREKMRSGHPRLWYSHATG